MRVCPICSVGLDALGKRRNAVYCSGACRAEASRIRHGRSAWPKKAHRKRTGRQGGANPRSRRPSDIRSSYDRNIQAITRVLTGAPLHIAPGLAARLAERAARDALTERQRAAVEKRDAG